MKSLHPVGTPKFKSKRAANLGVKKTPPTIKKKKSPRATKARAQWNLGLEKSLVDILHEHNNDFFRAQNGWSGDTWNRMTQIFQDRNQHVNFTKSQLQDKEKELKREYKMLREARMQSGAGWDEKSCRIVAEKALWDNLEISFPRIGKCVTAIKNDEMVVVVDRYVTLKEKQTADEKSESSIFSIAKCITAVNKIEDFTRQERVKASKIFKTLENRETFLTWVAEDEDSAIMWLRGELEELP